MRTLSSVALLCVLLAGCGKPIPNVDNPHRIVVDGKPMTALAFLDKYCQVQVEHPTCVAVGRAMMADATRGPMPKGWGY